MRRGRREARAMKGGVQEKEERRREEMRRGRREARAMKGGVQEKEERR